MTDLTKVREPERIARLPKDKRGYPIPWNILKGEDGHPFFIVNDDRKAWKALRTGVCQICGDPLGSWRWLVGGPMSAFDRHGAYIDLPMHRDCAEYALQVCPYLAAPRYMRHTDAVLHREKLPPEARILLDETVIPDRPQVMVAACAAKIELVDRSPLQPYLKPVRPLRDWTIWRHGRQIDEAEALPYLRMALGADWSLPCRA